MYRSLFVRTMPYILLCLKYDMPIHCQITCVHMNTGPQENQNLNRIQIS